MKLEELVAFKKRRAVFSGVLGMVFSLMLVLGFQLDSQHEIIWKMSTVASIVEFFLLFSIIMYFLFGILQMRKVTIKEPIKGVFSKRKIFWILFAVGLVFLIISFPGVYGYDGIYQLREFDTHNFATHYSFLYMNIFGVIINAVKGITGSYEIAFAVYIVLQLIFINIVLTNIVHYCYEKTKSKKVMIVGILFYALHLLVQILNISGAQDVLFGGLFALLILEIIRMVTEKDYLENRKNLIKVGVLTLLVCMTRNNGFFALVPFVIVGLVMLKGKRVRFGMLFIVPMVLYQVWQGPILTGLLGVKKQSIVHESLNLPVMQLTRAYVMNPSSWTDEEKDQFYKFYSKNCNFGKYKSEMEISDAFKRCSNDDYISSHLFDYVKLWMEIGLKNKENYVEAAGLLMLGAYYPFKTYNDSQMHHPFEEYRMMTREEGHMPNGVLVQRLSLVPFLTDGMNKLIQKGAWQKVPVFRIFWGGGIYGWLILFCIAYAWYIRNYKFLVPLALIFSLWGTVLLSPVVLFRYLYPIVLCTPLMFLGFSKKLVKQKGKK